MAASDHAQMLHSLLDRPLMLIKGGPEHLELLKVVVERHQGAQKVVEAFHKAAGGSALSSPEQYTAFVAEVTSSIRDQEPNAPNSIAAPTAARPALTANSTLAATTADHPTPQLGATTEPTAGAAVGATTSAKALEPTVAGAQPGGDHPTIEASEDETKTIVVRVPNLRRGKQKVVLLFFMMFCCFFVKNLLKRIHKHQEEPREVLLILAELFDDNGRALAMCVVLLLWMLKRAYFDTIV